MARARLSLERVCFSPQGEDSISGTSSKLQPPSQPQCSDNILEESPSLGYGILLTGTPIKRKELKAETPAPTVTPLQPHNTEDTPKRPLYEYYALKSEAETIVLESKKLWIDTPYSVSVVEDFQPPCEAEMIQSLLQESLNNYKPLPSLLRRRHRRSSRISSRQSPYASARMSRLCSTQEVSASPSPSLKRARNAAKANSPLSDALINRNSYSTPAKPTSILRPVRSPSRAKSGAAPTPSQSISTGRSEKRAGDKENQEPPKTPGGSLRIDRPRPRYRTPTPGRKRRPVRV